MSPVERVVYRDDRIEVGAFRCPAERADFRTAGQIRDHCAFVFPRTAVRIRQQGGPAFTADPARVVFYNPRQPFIRDRIHPDGDVCEWFAVDPAAAAEAVREWDAAAAEDEAAPFRLAHGPCDPASYLAQRELFHALDDASGAAAADPLAIEEGVLHLLGRVVALAYRARGHAAAEAGADSPRERHAVRRARDLLALRFREALSLGDVAREAGLSRFRLCRAFRRAAGTTLHAHQDQLRLRAALDELGQGAEDLTALALDLGYSSHSHFTASFRKAFDATPSRARARLRRPPPR